MTPSCYSPQEAANNVVVTSKDQFENITSGHGFVMTQIDLNVSWCIKIDASWLGDYNGTFPRLDVSSVVSYDACNNTKKWGNKWNFISSSKVSKFWNNFADCDSNDP